MKDRESPYGERRLIIALTDLAPIASLWTLFWGKINSLTEVYDFRPAQNGLSCYRMAQDGEWLAYRDAGRADPTPGHSTCLHPHRYHPTLPFFFGRDPS